MKPNVLVFLVFLVVVLCNCSPPRDYRKTLTTQISKNCTSVGLLCETCKELVACVKNPDNTFTKTHVQTCDSSTVCTQGKCWVQDDPICKGTADLAFPCKSVGIFPDPFYCNKFVLCVNMGQKIQGYLNECEEGLGYNIETGACDIKLENGMCGDEWPIPLCHLAGDSGALPGKPIEYYTCEEYSSASKLLYPVINVCPKGGVYNDYKCVEE